MASVSGYSILSTEMWPRYYIFTHFISICHFFLIFWNVTLFYCTISPYGLSFSSQFLTTPTHQSAVYRKISIKIKTTTTAATKKLYIYLAPWFWAQKQRYSILFFFDWFWAEHLKSLFPNEISIWRKQCCLSQKLLIA